MNRTATAPSFSQWQTQPLESVYGVAVVREYLAQLMLHSHRERRPTLEQAQACAAAMTAHSRHFVLRRVELGSLRLMPNLRPDAVECYRLLVAEGSACPPLLIDADTGCVTDGNHRASAAYAQGERYALALIAYS